MKKILFTTLALGCTILAGATVSHAATQTQTQDGILAPADNSSLTKVLDKNTYCVFSENAANHKESTFTWESIYSNNSVSEKEVAQYIQTLRTSSKEDIAKEVKVTFYSHDMVNKGGKYDINALSDDLLGSDPTGDNALFGPAIIVYYLTNQGNYSCDFGIVCDKAHFENENALRGPHGGYLTLLGYRADREQATIGGQTFMDNKIKLFLAEVADSEDSNTSAVLY